MTSRETPTALPDAPEGLRTTGLGQSTEPPSWENVQTSAM